MTVPDLVLDPGLRPWVLFPITFVMILVGILRHYATMLLSPTNKLLETKALRQQNFLAYGAALTASANNLSKESFQARQKIFSENFRKGVYVKDAGQSPGINAMTDPKTMETMMGGLKGQIMMFVPQTIMMGWINAFFAGFVLMKLPFPLTTRFKAMLQSGVATQDLDVRWVSSISWYIVNLLGLQSVYGLLLGDGNSAGGVTNQQPMANPLMSNPGTDFGKLYIAQAENLDLVKHDYLLDGIEKRIIRNYS